MLWYGIHRDFRFFDVGHIISIPLGSGVQTYFTAATMIIAIPTSIEICSWLANTLG